MSVRPIRRENVPASIASDLRRRILEGDLPPGSQMPGHRGLAAAYSVSVGSVREALSMLISAGLVETRAGRGTFVAVGGARPFPEHSAAPGVAGTGATLERAEVEQLVEAREVIEVALAAMAARRRDPDAIARLRACAARMQDASASPAAYSEADVEFHLALADAAGNRYLLRSMLAIRSLLKQDMELGAEAAIRRFGDLGVSVESHAALVDAIEAGDPELAAKVATTIVRRNRDFVLALYGLGPTAAAARAHGAR